MAGVANAIANFNRINKPVIVDIWGSSVSAQILRHCENVIVKHKFFRDPFIHAFDAPVAVDNDVIDELLSSYSREYSEAIKLSFQRKTLNRAKIDGGDWIILDFFDLAMRNIRYPGSDGESFTVDKFSLSTPLIASLINDGADVFDIFEYYDRDKAFKALDKTAEFVKTYYGWNIILNRI